eukprot:10476258-Karenia_brevis.AAC.1
MSMGMFQKGLQKKKGLKRKKRGLVQGIQVKGPQGIDVETRSKVPRGFTISKDDIDTHKGTK